MSKSFGAATILIVVSVLWLMDAYVALRPNSSKVPAAAMRSALKIIEENKKPGDIVVHSPLFSPSELAPLGKLDASPALPSARLRRSRRILVIDHNDAEMYGFGAPKHSYRIENSSDLLVKIYEPDASTTGPVFDLYTDIKRVKMSVEKPVGKLVSNCTAPRASGGRSCPGQPDWLYLDRRQLIISGQAQECVWAHPTNNGVIVLTIPPLEDYASTKSLKLTVRTGLTDDAVRTTSDGASVVTEIHQDNRVLAKVTAPNRIGLVEKTVGIKMGQAVQLRVTSAKDGRRHHCIMASVEAPRL